MATQTEAVSKIYDEQTAEYVAYHESSFAWRHIERPAFDRYISGAGIPGLINLYRPGAKALDIGCGAGLVVKHLASRGLAPQDITGIDISTNMLAEARKANPRSTFIQSSADDFEFPPGSFDLLVSNMTFHYLDDRQLRRCLELGHAVLRPEGSLVFVDADPAYSKVDLNTWTDMPTPWGSTAPWFCHDLSKLLLDDAYFAGFDVVAGGPSPISTIGGLIDPVGNQKYSQYPARMAARLQRVSNQEKQCRLNNQDKSIPSLT